MESVRLAGVLDGFWKHAPPVTGLDSLDTADSCFGGIRGERGLQTLGGFAHQRLGNGKSRLRDSPEIVSSLSEPALSATRDNSI